jgi:hypothetical protein
MILSIILLLSSFPNVCGENAYSSASCHARRLAQQVALVCGGLKGCYHRFAIYSSTKFDAHVYVNTRQ